jgi:uncharacterized protein YqgC (DUF456 family)
MTADWLVDALRVAISIGLLAGWAATIVPIFPAPTVMWALSLLYGLLTGFDRRGSIFFAGITLLTIASWLTDNLFGIAGARKGGARWSSVAIASAVGLVTSLLLTPIVGILLTLTALFLAELAHKGNAAEAWASTKHMLLGWGWSTVVRLGLGLIVVALWGIWAWL